MTSMIREIVYLNISVVSSDFFLIADFLFFVYSDIFFSTAFPKCSPLDIICKNLKFCSYKYWINSN